MPDVRGTFQRDTMATACLLDVPPSRSIADENLPKQDRTDIDIRALLREDEPEWRRLWTAYLTFYDSSVAEEVYATTFERLLSDDPWMPSSLVAEIGGKPVGLVHYIYHSHCWRTDRVCYLQDLFADPQMRGRGVGRALIEAACEQADADGAPSVYWLTQEHNRDARLLYDRIATLTPFIKYQRG